MWLGVQRMIILLPLVMLCCRLSMATIVCMYDYVSFPQERKDQDTMNGREREISAAVHSIQECYAKIVFYYVYLIFILRTTLHFVTQQTSCYLFSSLLILHCFPWNTSYIAMKSKLRLFYQTKRMLCTLFLQYCKVVSITFYRNLLLTFIIFVPLEFSFSM